MIKTTYSCPFGATCEKITSEGIDRCRLYICIAGENPQTGEKMEDWNCAFSWQPMLMIDQSRSVKGTQCATEELRNSVATGNQAMVQMFAINQQNQQRMLKNGTSDTL
jgi:hypothetical protein